MKSAALRTGWNHPRYPLLVLLQVAMTASHQDCMIDLRVVSKPGKLSPASSSAPCHHRFSFLCNHLQHGFFHTLNMRRGGAEIFRKHSLTVSLKGGGIKRSLAFDAGDDIGDQANGDIHGEAREGAVLTGEGAVLTGEGAPLTAPFPGKVTEASGSNVVRQKSGLGSVAGKRKAAATKTRYFEQGQLNLAQSSEIEAPETYIGVKADKGQLYVVRRGNKIIGRYPSARAGALAFDFASISAHFSAAAGGDQISGATAVGKSVSATRRMPRVNFADSWALWDRLRAAGQDPLLAPLDALSLSLGRVASVGSSFRTVVIHAGKGDRETNSHAQRGQAGGGGADVCGGIVGQGSAVEAGAGGGVYTLEECWRLARENGLCSRQQWEEWVQAQVKAEELERRSSGHTLARQAIQRDDAAADGVQEEHAAADGVEEHEVARRGASGRGTSGARGRGMRLPLNLADAFKGHPAWGGYPDFFRRSGHVTHAQQLRDWASGKPVEAPAGSSLHAPQAAGLLAAMLSGGHMHKDAHAREETSFQHRMQAWQHAQELEKKRETQEKVALLRRSQFQRQCKEEAKALRTNLIRPGWGWTELNTTRLLPPTSSSSASTPPDLRTISTRLRGTCTRLLRASCSTSSTPPRLRAESPRLAPPSTITPDTPPPQQQQLPSSTQQQHGSDLQTLGGELKSLICREFALAGATGEWGGSRLAALAAASDRHLPSPAELDLEHRWENASTALRNEVYESAAKSKNWDLTLFKAVLPSVTTCRGCGKWPLICTGQMYSDSSALWCRHVCSNCGLPPKGEDWFPIDTHTKHALVNIQLLDRARDGDSLDPQGSHKHQHILCIENRSALNAVRDLEYEDLARACNRSYFAVKEELDALSVPELLSFTPEEARLLAGFNVSVPVGRFVCSEHLHPIRAAHLSIVRRMAERDGFEVIRLPLTNSTSYFHVDSTSFKTEEELLLLYRRLSRHQDPVAQDCKIPFLKIAIQPNLEPEKYQRVNDYVKDLVARRHHQVWPGDDDEVKEAQRALRRKIYEKVTAAAAEPLVGGLCEHVVELAEYVCHLWSPTGLLLHPSVLRDFLRDKAEEVS